MSFIYLKRWRYYHRLIFATEPHLNTPKKLTDASGVVVWAASHTPFGQATVDEDVDGDGNGVTLDIRFPGQHYDAETGLHYNYFRYYDPATGRYITSDPIGLDGGLDTYLYADANPLRYTDPYGLFNKEKIKKKFCKKANESCHQLHKRILKFCATTGAGLIACKTLADDIAIDCLVGGFPGCKEEEKCEDK